MACDYTSSEAKSWIFRTREGSGGILQILATNRNPPGVRLRYKLARQDGGGGGTAPSTGQGAVAPEFEPAVEAVLVHPEGRVAELLDLDTGQRATSTDFGEDDRETHAWIRSSRVDVLGVVEKGRMAALCLDMVVAPAGSNSWDAITARGVGTNWHLAQGEQDKITVISPIADKTDTWFFRTREGGQGVLQIVGQTANPSGVKVRYRLVQPGHDATSSQSGTATR
jgi:hypothetical protein